MPGERAAALLKYNRATGRRMPASRAERRNALTIMEWAHDDPAAEAAAPELVAVFRKFCTQTFGQDEALWRTAFDLALDVWKAEREAMKRAAF